MGDADIRMPRVLVAYTQVCKVHVGRASYLSTLLMRSISLSAVTGFVIANGCLIG